MGAPGYQPYQELPPHAPMPGAPPYPAGTAPGPAPVDAAGPRTNYWKALGATAIGAALHLVLLFVLAGPPASPEAFGAVIGGTMLLPVAFGSLVLWLIARKRVWPFWRLALVGVLLYVAFRAVFTVLQLAGAR